MSDSSVQTLTIYGHQYSIRASREEQQALEQASVLLHEQLKVSEQLYPYARTNELLVLTALNLCVPLTQSQEKLEHAQVVLDGLLARVRAQLG